MKDFFPTYNEFRTFNNKWRQHFNKERQHKFVIAFYYPFAILGLCFLYAIFFWAVESVKGSSSKNNYRRSSKYKKVIKEGLFFDTVEYHER